MQAKNDHTHALYWPTFSAEGTAVDDFVVDVKRVAVMVAATL